MADVSIDASISTSAARGRRAVAFVSSLVGYWFYIDSTGTFVYSKTTDGGATWGAAVTISSATTNVAFDIWAEWWTPGTQNGTKILMTYFDTTVDTVFYRVLTTGADTLGTQRSVFVGASAVAGRGSFCSVTLAVGGNIYVAYDIDAGAEKGLHVSTDGGPTWSANLSTTFVEATLDECLLFPAMGTGDTNDLWALYLDASASAITLKLWDVSAGSQVESATIQTVVHQATDLTGQFNFSASIRLSDGHLILASCNDRDTATADHEIFDITSTSSFTAKTAITTNIDDHYHPALFIDQNTNDLYVAYNGKRDGSEVIGTTTKVYYTKSTNGGTSWSAGDTAYMEGAAGVVVQVWAPIMGPRFYVGWRVGTTLLGNNVNSLSFAYKYSGTDGAKASDSATATGTFPRSGTDGAKASDSVIVSRNFSSAGTDGAKASDSATAPLTRVGSGTDGAKASDSATPSQTRVGSGTDGAKASDSATAPRVRPASGTDGAKATDSATAPRVMVGSGTDGAKATDSATAPRVRPAAGTDGAKASDDATAPRVRPAAGTDGAKATDNATAPRIRPAAGTDGAKGSDSGSASITVPVTGTDGAKVSDDSTVTQSIPAIGGDSAKAADSASVTSIRPAAGTDGAKAVDNATVTRDLPATGTDGAKAVDTGDTTIIAAALGSDTAKAADSADASRVMQASGTDGAVGSDSGAESSTSNYGVTGFDGAKASDQVIIQLIRQVTASDGAKTSDSAINRLIIPGLGADGAKAGDIALTTVIHNIVVSDGAIASDIGNWLAPFVLPDFIDITLRPSKVSVNLVPSQALVKLWPSVIMVDLGPSEILANLELTHA